MSTTLTLGYTHTKNDQLREYVESFANMILTQNAENTEKIVETKIAEEFKPIQINTEKKTEIIPSVNTILFTQLTNLRKILT